MGTMLCWCMGAFRAADGWLRESTTLNSGVKLFAEVEAKEASTSKSRSSS